MIHRRLVFDIFFNKELFIALYFLLFIIGYSGFVISDFYNFYRLVEVFLLLGFYVFSTFKGLYSKTKYDFIFIAFIIISSFFWQNSLFIIADLMMYFLLFKSFLYLKYNENITKAIITLSLLIFIFLPLAVLDYIDNGSYNFSWYPLPWNIRVFDSYFLIVSILATWFYIKDIKYKYLFFLVIFLSTLAILLDAGRSATLAYAFFVLTVCLFNKRYRFSLIAAYAASWLSYLTISYTANIDKVRGLNIVRESSSGRLELWHNAIQCWLHYPIVGCGFYQLEQYTHLSAHPHNLFIQVLTETGIIGFGFLLFVIYSVIKNISWNLKKNYFVIAALIAVTIDISLSGAYVYPVTQVALLWLFIFLLKNPEFEHSSYFNEILTLTNRPQQVLSIIIYTLITILSIYLSFQAFSFPDDMLSTPPRFWDYGYKLY